MVQNRNNVEMEIILVLLRNKTHLREIARTLNESHSTVLRKINELTKENILDYKREGKNKVFFIKNNLKAKNYIYSAEIHKLNKLLKKHPELSIILEEIKKNFPKGMIILFGSYAKGNPKSDSDIDIYLETNNNHLKDKVKQINSKLSVKIGKFDKNSLLIKEIIKNHIIIRGLEDFYERVNFSKET
ncbi:MAG: nucleotidyltransferase domain-containing protein [Candidatus Pacearchaeota archaeon]|jgi:predicted nucleotidyltransferase